MRTIDKCSILEEKYTLQSVFLQREVEVDFYLPPLLNEAVPYTLLLINDGQLMNEMGLAPILEYFSCQKQMSTVVCVAIHAGKEREMEYGIAAQADYLGRGARAGSYTSFILNELLPFIYNKFSSYQFLEKTIAGFSLGGLMALDIVWSHPDVFSKAGVFSGSFWWRSMDQEDKSYDDNKHRIMHQQIRSDRFKPGLKFFFQCGNKDETRDRNQNGIIDSIDDTCDLVKELVQKGYDPIQDIFYLELKDGLHDTNTWAKAFPEFLKWLGVTNYISKLVLKAPA